MTAPAASVALTDDEVAAAAFKSGATWPSPLPTLVDRSEGELAAAVFRGWRSLTVRDLLTDGAPAAHVAAVIAAVVANDVAYRAFVVVESGQISAKAPVTTVYRALDGWLIEIVTPDGVHSFGWADEPGCRRLLVDTLAGVQADGLSLPADFPDQLPRPIAFHAMAGHDDRVVTAVVRDGLIRLVSGSEERTVDVSEAVDALLRASARVAGS